MLVLDASAAVRLLLHDGSSATTRVRRTISSPFSDINVPSTIFDLEVLNAVRKGIAAKRISSEIASNAVNGLKEMPLNRREYFPFADRVWGLRNVLVPYDAIYLVLAEKLDATLLTFDRGLATAAQRQGVRVQLFK